MTALDYLQVCCVGYLIIWSVSPPLQVGTVFRLAALGFAVAWFFIEFLSHIEFSKMQVWCLLYMLAAVIAAFLLSGATGVIREIALFMMVLCSLMDMYLDGKRENNRAVLVAALAVSAVFNLTTLRVLLADATIARQIVRNNEVTSAYLRQGVGGYGLIYLEVCIFPAVLGWTLKAFKNDRAMFAFGAVWTATFIALVVNAGYSIAIFTVFATTLIVVLYRGRKLMPALIIALLILGIGLYLIVYADWFRNALLNFFEGTKVVKKIEDLITSITDNTASGSIGDRVKRYRQSLEALLQYPLLGSWNVSAGGGHSEIMDKFVKYGPFGGIPFVYMWLFGTWRYRDEKYDIYTSSVANATLVSLLFVGVLDTIAYQMMAPVILLVPVLLEDIDKWSNEEDEDSLDGEPDTD